MTFSGILFFSFNSAWIFGCAFQFSRKNILLYIFLTEMLLFGFVAFIIFDINDFFVVFLRNINCKQVKKIIQGKGLLLNWKAHAKIQALLKEKNLTKKVTYVPLAQVIQLYSSWNISPVHSCWEEQACNHTVAATWTPLLFIKRHINYNLPYCYTVYFVVSCLLSIRLKWIKS